MMQQYRRVRDLEGMPTIEIESVEEFFDKAMTDYPDAPRWVGELYFETHRGTYTSQAKTKAGNRRCELLLREAELWCVAAYGTTVANGYPKEQLDRIWKTVLLHQFHDILPGSSIAWVHREAEETYERLMVDLESIIAAALEALVGTSADGSAGPSRLAVANAAPHARDEVAIVDASVLDGVDRSALHLQPLADGTVALRVCADAMAIGAPAPVVGADRVTVTRSTSDGADRIVMSTDRLVVTFDDAGLVTSCVATGSSRDAIVPGARGNLLQLHPDFPTEYDAWDLDESYRRQTIDLDEADSVEVIDEGPLVGRVRVTRSFRSSAIVQTYELRAGSPRLDIHTEIDWHERDHVLKASFPLDVHTDHLTREIQFGHLTTAIHTNTSWDAARFEVCAHRWADAAEPGYGVALLNDAKYGYDATRTRTSDDRPATTLRLTLLKGAQYPDPHADEGHHSFTYALMPHAGDFREAGVIEQGWALNLPLRVLRAHGPAPDSGAPVVVANDLPNAVVAAVKPADDGSGDLIVRVHEAWGMRTSLGLRFAFEPAAVTVVDLLEAPNDDIPSVALDVWGATVLGELRPFQVVTLRVAR
jgi:alpha-mannosidase